MTSLVVTLQRKKYIKKQIHMNIRVHLFLSLIAEISLIKFLLVYREQFLRATRLCRKFCDFLRNVYLNLQMSIRQNIFIFLSKTLLQGVRFTWPPSYYLDEKNIQKKQKNKRTRRTSSSISSGSTLSNTVLLPYNTTQDGVQECCHIILHVVCSHSWRSAGNIYSLLWCHDWLIIEKPQSLS